MKNLAFLILLLVACKSNLYSQNESVDTLCTDCPCLLVKGDLMAQDGKNAEAINLYQAYLVCAPADVDMVTARLKTIQNKLEKEKKEAQEAERRANELKNYANEAAKKSVRQARASHNLAVTQKTQVQNPTMALRIAEGSLQYDEENEDIQQAYAEIFSDEKNFFYRTRYFEGHQGKITVMALSPGGQIILTAGSDKTLKIWNKQGSLLRTFKSLPGDVSFAVFFANGKKVLFGNAGWAMVGDTSGTVLSRIQLPKDHWFRSLAFSANSTIDKVYFSRKGAHLLVCGSDSSAAILNIRNPNQSVLFSKSNAIVTNGDFSPFGDSLITVSGDTAHLRNLKGKILNTFSNQKEEISQAKFIGNDSLLLEFKNTAPLLINSKDPIQYAKPFRAAEEKNKTFGTHIRGDRLFMFSKPKSGSDSKSFEIRVFSLEGQYKDQFIMPSKDEWPDLVDVTNSDEYILYFKNGSTFESYTFSKLKPVSFPPTNSNISDSGAAYAAFSPDGNMFVYYLPGDTEATVRKTTDAPSKKPLRPKKSNLATSAIEVNPDSTANKKYFLLIRHADSTVSLMDTTAREYWSSVDILNPVLEAKFSSSGRNTFLLDSKYTIWLLRVENNELTRVGEIRKGGNNDAPPKIAVSPLGSSVAVVVSGGEPQIFLWRIKGKKLWEKVNAPVFNNNVEDVSFPSEKRILVRTSNGEISLWETDKPDKPIHIWNGFWSNDATAPWKYAVPSPQGDRVLFIGDENSVTLTDLNANISNPLKGQRAAVTSATFSADGNYILTADKDNILRVWNGKPPGAGKMVAQYSNNYKGGIRAAAISPNGTHVLSVDGAGNAFLWKTPKELRKSGDIDSFRLRDLANNGLLPDPDSDELKDMETTVLKKTAYNFLKQRDTVTAHKLFNYLVDSSKQEVKVWYDWYVTGGRRQRNLDTMRDSIIAQNQDIYLAAWLFKSGGLYKEAKDLLEHLIKTQHKTEHLWEYIEACRLSRSSALLPLILLDTVPERLANYAHYFLESKTSTMARSLFLKSLEKQASASGIIGLIEINRPEDSQFVRNKTGELADQEELLRLADYFKDKKIYPRAAELYRRILASNEVPEAYIGLYEISSLAEQKRIRSKMLQSKSPDALRRYVDFFGEKKPVTLKINALDTLIGLGMADPYDRFDRYRIMKDVKNKDTFEELESLNSPADLKSLMKYFANQGENERDSVKKVDYYEKAVKLGERLIQKDSSGLNREALSVCYNRLGWFRIYYTGEFARSEKDIRRGIKVYPDNLMLYTNLPHTLLFQNKIEEAQKIYTDYAAKGYQPERNLPCFRDVYRADFAKFKARSKVLPGKPFTKEMMDEVANIEKDLKSPPPITAKKKG